MIERMTMESRLSPIFSREIHTRYFTRASSRARLSFAFSNGSEDSSGRYA